MSQTLQQYVQQILNGVVNNLNTPGNAFYFPTWLASNGYDPYGKNIAMNWPFTMNSTDMLNAASNICSDIGGANPSVCASYKDDYIGDPANAPVLTLGGAAGDLLVSGFSNALIQGMTVQNDDLPLQISTNIVFSTLPNFPPEPVISGNFSLLQHCCCSTDGKTCDLASVPYTGSGTFTASIVGVSNAAIMFEITQLAQGVLDLQVNSINLTVPTSGGAPNINTTVNIQSFPPGTNTQSYNNLAAEAFNSPSGKTDMIQQINSVMNQPGQLSSMTEALSKVVDQYLESNNLYPFNHASLALV